MINYNNNMKKDDVQITSDCSFEKHDLNVYNTWSFVLFHLCIINIIIYCTAKFLQSNCLIIRCSKQPPLFTRGYQNVPPKNDIQYLILKNWKCKNYKEKRKIGKIGKKKSLKIQNFLKCIRFKQKNGIFDNGINIGFE